MAASLSTYRAKRNFQRTTEPVDEAPVGPSERLRFVIQKHDATRLHYDLRLELDGVFKSWAVTRGPSLDPQDKRLAVEVEDHPLAYGDFEGTIPEGEYGGGTVQLWDRGFWEPEGEAGAAAMLAGGDLKFVLHGTRLHGSWVLVRMKADRARKGRSGGKRTNWLLIKHRDAAAKEGDGDALLAPDRSVASGRAMATIANGKGRAPKPFMAGEGKGIAPDAVWDSAQGLAAEMRAARGSHHAKQKRTAKGSVAMPPFVAPHLCATIERPPAGAGWVHEIKFDGYRIQARIEDGVATLRSRSGLDWTARFPALAKSLATWPDAILDTEVVALDADGTPDFAALQAALSDKATDDLVAYVFDLLFHGGEDLRGLPLGERKTRLKALMAAAGAPTLRYVEHFTTGGDAILQSACRLSLEGIVSKRLSAPYASGRGKDWTKAKCRAGHEVVIGGWTTTGQAFRSLLVGARRGGHLVYLGRVGTGFGGAKVAALMPHLEAAAAKTSPFTGANAPKGAPGIHWLRPDLVAEIQFAGWTGDGMVRQAAFKALREDKAAADVEAETPAPAATVETPSLEARPSPKPKTSAKAKAAGPPSGRYAQPAGSARATIMGVAISHADKALWPEAGHDGTPVTKRDLATYFEAVGSWMLPHIERRPCSIVRAPDGFAGETFFQRHALPHSSNLLDLVRIAGDKKPYLSVARIEGLAALAQVAALELHPANGVAGAPETPGRLVFDLDPGPDVAFAMVVETAHLFRERLKALGLESFCKTTGGKGLHVVAPLAPPRKGGPDWPEAKAFARDLCTRIASEDPQRFVMTMAKKQRQGRIYLDYLRNDALSTAVAPLSPRARPGATVSMPIMWEEATATMDPGRFTLRSVPALIAASKAWDGYDAARKPLAGAIKRFGKG